MITANELRERSYLNIMEYPKTVGPLEAETVITLAAERGFNQVRFSELHEEVIDILLDAGYIIVGGRTVRW